MAVVDTKTVIETPRSRMTMGQFTDRALMAECIEEVKDTLLHYPPIVVYGKRVNQQRDVGFYSDESEGYHYSGQVAKSQPLTSGLKKLITVVNSQFDAVFNGILVNRYNHGNDYISPHSDDERFLDKKAGVVSISVGATRTFVIRGKVNLSFATGIPLSDMTVVHMAGEFQKEFTHGIPAVSAVSDIRYSFTFRRHEI